MRFYSVNKIKHKVYEPDDILPEGMIVQSHWQNGQVGAWVKADDDCIIQILRRGQMHKAKGKSRVVEYIGTCTGTFLTKDSVRMDTSRRINIYSLSGNKKSDDILLDRDKLNKHDCQTANAVQLIAGTVRQCLRCDCFP